MNGGCSKVLFWASEESIVLEEGRMSKVSCSTETQAVSYPSGRLLNFSGGWFQTWTINLFYTESTHVGTYLDVHTQHV